MQRKIQTLISTASLLMLGASSFPQPAGALSLEKMVEYYIGTSQGTSLAPNQKLIADSFDKRTSQLSSAIAANERTGKVPAADADKFKFELNRLKDQYQRYQLSDGGYTHGETNLIVQDFSELSTRIQSVVRRSGAPASYTDISSKQAELRNRIEAAARDQTLSRAEADSIRYSLRWIDKLKADLIGNGGFTRADHDVVSSDLNRVNNRLTRWINNNIASQSDDDTF